MVSCRTGLADVPRATLARCALSLIPGLTRASLLERRIAVSGGISASAARHTGAGQLRKFPACLVAGFTQMRRLSQAFLIASWRGNEQDTVSAACSLIAEASCNDGVEEVSEE